MKTGSLRHLAVVVGLCGGTTSPLQAQYILPAPEAQDVKRDGGLFGLGGLAGPVDAPADQQTGSGMGRLRVGDNGLLFIAVNKSPIAQRYAANDLAFTSLIFPDATKAAGLAGGHFWFNPRANHDGKVEANLSADFAYQTLTLISSAASDIFERDVHVGTATLAGLFEWVDVDPNKNNRTRATLSGALVSAFVMTPQDADYWRRAVSNGGVSTNYHAGYVKAGVQFNDVFLELAIGKSKGAGDSGDSRADAVQTALRIGIAGKALGF